MASKAASSFARRAGRAVQVSEQALRDSSGPMSRGQRWAALESLCRVKALESGAEVTEAASVAGVDVVAAREIRRSKSRTLAMMR